MYVKIKSMSHHVPIKKARIHAALRRRRCGKVGLKGERGREGERKTRRGKKRGRKIEACP